MADFTIFMESKASVEEEGKRFEAAKLDRHAEMAKTNALLTTAPTTERDAKNGGSHRARAHEPPTPAATPRTHKRVAHDAERNSSLRRCWTQDTLRLLGLRPGVRFEAAKLDRHAEMAKTNALFTTAPTTERDAKNGGSHRARAYEPPTPTATPRTHKRVAHDAERNSSLCRCWRQDTLRLLGF
jgi:hypothetical protein